MGMAAVGRTNRELLSFAIAMALMNVKVRATKSTRIKLSEEDRYAVAADAVDRLRGYGAWLDANAPEGPIGLTGPSTYKPSQGE